MTPRSTTSFAKRCSRCSLAAEGKMTEEILTRVEMIDGDNIDHFEEKGQDIAGLAEGQ